MFVVPTYSTSTVCALFMHMWLEGATGRSYFFTFPLLFLSVCITFFPALNDHYCVDVLLLTQTNNGVKPCTRHINHLIIMLRAVQFCLQRLFYGGMNRSPKIPVSYSGTYCHRIDYFESLTSPVEFVDFLHFVT